MSRNTAPNSIWTPEAHETLVRMAADGCSQAVIAQALGFPRSAVAGRAFRSGIRFTAKISIKPKRQKSNVGKRCRVKRPLKIEGDVVVVPLTKGMVAVVDLADLPLVSGKNWCATKGYAMTIVDGERVLLHRLILNAPCDLDGDHIDGDKMNNRRANLRLVTHQQNMCNQMPSRRKTSKFKGVSRAYDGKWIAQIRSHGAVKKLGRFKSEVEAARAYDEAAEVLHGPFAKTNAILGLLQKAA